MSAATRPATIRERARALAEEFAEKSPSNPADFLPDFVMDKMNESERYAWNSSEDSPMISRETEKAVLLAKETDFGTVTVWCPKSVLKSPEVFRESGIKKKTSFMVGRQYNAYLRQFAAHSGVKIGNTRRTDKILEKLSKSGKSPMTKDEFSDSTSLPKWFNEEPNWL